MFGSFLPFLPSPSPYLRDAEEGGRVCEGDGGGEVVQERVQSYLRTRRTHSLTHSLPAPGRRLPRHSHTHTHMVAVPCPREGRPELGRAASSQASQAAGQRETYV